MDRDELAAGSWVVAGGRPDAPGEPLNHPLVPASTFLHGDERLYSRADATTGWEAFESVVGGLEGGRATAFSSGMAAVAAVLSTLDVGAVVALPDDAYQGVAMLVDRGAEQGRWTVRRLPTADTDAWVAAVGEVDLAWLESPSNPLLEVADVPTIASSPRRPDSVLVVDNTFATPLNQRPLALGADLVVHSATKFLGGHSDLLAGVVVAPAAGTRDDLAEAVRTSRTLEGATPGTLETFLALRGVRTLALRLGTAQASAAVLAERLSDHEAVTRVRWPGLAEHPGHELAARTMDSFGSMLSLEVAGGAEAADRVCRTVRLVRHATSLGGVETSVERRAALPGQEHLPAGLLRLSVGIEDVEDLWHDLDTALSGTPS
ncbi:trans-sulfuration enzyme family protein [Salsipaludibacter albus]|uniref:trans-sulfuration enzyme family protein n=1 Tax=Salsipaludibacter albus TaxID=2849650 RepID=UPI001EE46B54|nr:PLP-dependent transferase [Salsipaludibacter albus]MBY5162714.1 PLP-dependent transferase [Salsipaludibacter albus]